MTDMKSKLTLTIDGVWVIIRITKNNKSTREDNISAERTKYGYKNIMGRHFTHK